MSNTAEDSGDGATVTCAGCRQSGPRADLERFVYHDETGIMFDMRRGAPGDAAWIHPLPGCLRAACWAGFSRAFGEPFDGLEVRSLYEELEDGLHRRLREALIDAARLGDAVVGRDAVRERRAAGAVENLFVEPGAAEEVVEELDAARDEAPVAFDEFRPGTLRRAFGEEVEVVGVCSGERADRLGRIGEKLICLYSEELEEHDTTN